MSQTVHASTEHRDREKYPKCPYIIETATGYLCTQKYCHIYSTFTDVAIYVDGNIIDRGNACILMRGAKPTRTSTPAALLNEMTY